MEIDRDTRDYYFEAMRQLPEYALLDIMSGMYGTLEGQLDHSDLLRVMSRIQVFIDQDDIIAEVGR